MNRTIKSELKPPGGLSLRRIKNVVIQFLGNLGFNIQSKALPVLAEYCLSMVNNDGLGQPDIESFCRLVASGSKTNMIEKEDVEKAIQKEETGDELDLKEIIKCQTDPMDISFDPTTSQFMISWESNSKRTMDLTTKVRFVNKRFVLLQEICKTTQRQLTTIRKLCSSVSSERVVVTGLLTMNPDGSWILESDGGSVKLAFDRGQPPIAETKGFFYEGCVVMARGVHSGGVMNLESISQPPLMSREASELMVREHYKLVLDERSVMERVSPILPLFIDPEKMSRIERSLVDSRRGTIVTVADVRLDTERGKTMLRTMLDGYSRAKMHLDCIVIIGPFVDTQNSIGDETGLSLLERAFKDLKSLLSSFSAFLSRTQVVLVPSSQDPVVLPGVIPIGPFPDQCTSVFKGLDRITCTFSPSHIEIFGRHFIFHDTPDINQQMSLISFPTTGPTAKSDLETFEYLTETLFAQRTLHPFLPEARPVRWNMDPHLSLFPTPDVIILSGFLTPLILEGKSWAVSPGSFSGRGEFVVCYVETTGVKCEASKITLK